MSILTPFFNLIKPAKTDPSAIAQLNSNMDTIDTEMHKPPLTVNGVEPDSTTRDLYLQEVPLADNLASDIAQVEDGLFIERTSGGSTSIETGDASLLFVKGNLVRSGYVAESLTHTESDGLEVSIDRDTFVSYVAASGTLTFTYTTVWSADLTDYGITVTGEPQAGDTIVVVYVKEDRGTITTATPAAFESTGWNLYDNSTGYAKVINYSNTYGYKLGGTYSLVEFAETTTGTRSAVSLVDGYFFVPADGYVFVTGGDETTYIYATWTDWTDAYVGDFQTYTVDTISLSEAMLLFPYGLCAVGDVRDEINLNVSRCVQRIGRTSYDNLDTVVASGAAYIYDTNYVYYVLKNPVTTTVEIDPVYSVDDHGIEFFTGTTVPVYTQNLYGENLKDKLRTDVVTLSAQNLSSTQQAQVRTNLGMTIANNLTTTSSGYVLDARQGKALKDDVATNTTDISGLLPRKLTSFGTITQNQTKTYSAPGNTYGILFIYGPGTNYIGMWMFLIRGTTASGTAVVTPVLAAGSNVTVVADGKNVKVTNAYAQAVNVSIVTFIGPVDDITVS